jgi:hypothetical protein
MEDQNKSVMITALIAGAIAAAVFVATIVFYGQ